MSRPTSPHQTIHIREESTDTDDPQPTRGQTSLGHSRFSDISDPLFTTYLKVADEEDRRKAELLKGDTDQILVFCGLFSAAIAAIVVPSISDLTPYYELPSGTKVYTKTPPSAVIYNSLWLLSLVISMTCALMAMSLQQWARRHAILPQYTLHKEAQMRAFFADGREAMDLSVAVNTLTALVHISVALFVYGGLVCLRDIHNTVFIIACCWVAVSFLVYGTITCLPIFRPDSPYYTPLSNSAVRTYTAILRGASLVMWLFTRGGNVQEHVQHFKDHYRNWDSLTLETWAERKVQVHSSTLDGKVLKWTLDSARGDHDLEQFFEAIPGFCNSKMVDDSPRSLDILGRQKLAGALVGLWNRTLSSNLVSEIVKERRLIICMGVIKAANLAISVPQILHVNFVRSINRISRAPDIGHSLGNLRNSNIASFVRGIIAGIISNAERDRRWSTLVMDELGISEDVLRNYLTHGDSVLFANLIHITRHFFDSLHERHQDLAQESLCILQSLSRFDILNTLPELQRDFCNLWHLIIQEARNNGAGNNPFIEILIQIQPLFIALHPTTATSADFFPNIDYILSQPPPSAFCEIADHHSNLTCDLREAIDSTTSGATHSPTITSLAYPIPESSHNDVPSVPQHVSSSAITATSLSCTSESQNSPTISPSPRTCETQEIANTSPGSSIEKPIVRSPSLSRNNALERNEGTTGSQTEPFQKLENHV